MVIQKRTRHVIGTLPSRCIVRLLCAILRPIQVWLLSPALALVRVRGWVADDAR